MNYQTLNLASIILLCLCGLFLIISILLFVRFRIIRVIGDLSGRTAKKQIEKIRSDNETSGNKKKFMPTPLNKSLKLTGHITNKLSKSKHTEKIGKTSQNKGGFTENNSITGKHVNDKLKSAITDSHEELSSTPLLNRATELLDHGTEVLCDGTKLLSDNTTLLESTAVLSEKSSADDGHITDSHEEIPATPLLNRATELLDNGTEVLCDGTKLLSDNTTLLESTAVLSGKSSANDGHTSILGSDTAALSSNTEIIEKNENEEVHNDFAIKKYIIQIHTSEVI
jgi:hypothetical protein